tara:strand:- start:417 stop:755 length:339 start_codon:yes stop_codon:yes gene_type:complete
MIRSRVLAFTLVLALSSARADGIPEPTGQHLLWVGGEIEITNMMGPAAGFDRAIPEGLGMHEITTSTPFTDGVNTFRGPLLRDLLDTVIANGDTISVTALDHYTSSFPGAEA